MSSTLYNRGTTTQTSVKRRAEAIDKSITEMRAAIASSDEVARQVRFLEARVAALEASNTALKAAVAQLSAPAPAPATE